MAPDRIQEHRALQPWIDGLTEADLAQLARVYERVAAGGHMGAAKRELRADPPDDVRRHRLFLLFLLFDHLGDRGFAPFDSFRVGNRAIPEEPVDWSALPEDLRWVIEPAEKYGSLRFESRVLDYIDGMGEAGRVEARRLRARFAVEAERLQSVGCDGPLKPGELATAPRRNELFPKAVDGRDRSSGFSFSVDEHDAVDQVLQLGAAVQFPPA